MFNLELMEAHPEIMTRLMLAQARMDKISSSDDSNIDQMIKVFEDMVELFKDVKKLEEEDKK